MAKCRLCKENIGKVFIFRNCYTKEIYTVIVCDECKKNLKKVIPQ